MVRMPVIFSHPINTGTMLNNYAVQDSTHVLNASFITSRVSMPRAIELMEDAFRILSEKSAFIPARVVVTNPEDTLSVFFKPAFFTRFNRMSIKILSQIIANTNPDIPTIKGMVMLIDMTTGQVLSISDGQSITALRTGAASGIATSYLANPDASSVAVFGCGAQGRTQLEAVMAVRPITEVYLFDPGLNQAVNLKNSIGLNGKVTCEINPPLDILKNVDVICTATPSKKPLFSLSHLKSGVHINAVGSYRPDMQEIDPEIFRNSLTYLDDAAACVNDSGDIIRPLESGIIREEDIIGELGELIAGSVTGRRSSGEITIFKTVGNAIQDFFIANEAYEMSLLLSSAQVINLNA